MKTKKPKTKQFCIIARKHIVTHMEAADRDQALAKFYERGTGAHVEHCDDKRLLGPCSVCFKPVWEDQSYISIYGNKIHSECARKEPKFQ